MLFESILQFLHDHFIMIVELVGLWTMLSIGVHINKRITRITRIIIILILIESIIWSIEQWTHSFDKYCIARPMLLATIYLLHPVILIAITEMLVPIEKGWSWILNPLLVSIPILYTSQWTHVIFWITEDNKFKGNEYFVYFPYALFSLYVFIFLFLYISQYAKHNRSSRIGIIYIGVISIVGVVLQLIMDEDNDYSTLFSSIVILYYLFLYMQMARTDSLTQLLNRQCLYYDSESRKNDISGVVSVDMNDLKPINDRYGHEAGDKALKKVAECISVNSGEHKSVYRIGGDEFVIIYFGVSDDRIVKDIEEMRKLLDKTDYSCAFGYAAMNSKYTFDEVMCEADYAMYKNKAEIKGFAYDRNLDRLDIAEEKNKDNKKEIMNKSECIK